jgi:hypothetical protein
MPNRQQTDPIVEAVRARLHQRSQVGIAKYGTTVARSDLDMKDWLNHALDEALDLAVYLQRVIAGIEAREFQEPDNDQLQLVITPGPLLQDATREEVDSALCNLFMGLSGAITRHACDVDISDPNRIVVTGTPRQLPEANPLRMEEIDRALESPKRRK